MPDLLLILIVILILVLLWRGPRNLPKLGEALGRGFKGARQEAAKVQEEIQVRATTDPADRTTATAPVEDPITTGGPGPDRPG